MFYLKKSDLEHQKSTAKIFLSTIQNIEISKQIKDNRNSLAV